MNITLHYLNDSEQGKRRVILENPKWTEVKARIAELDGLKKTEINLKNNDSAEELTIGGGRNRYIISWLRGDGSNGSLISPEFIGSEQQIELSSEISLVYFGGN